MKNNTNEFYQGTIFEQGEKGQVTAFEVCEKLYCKVCGAETNDLFFPYCRDCELEKEDFSNSAITNIFRKTINGVKQ